MRFIQHVPRRVGMRLMEWVGLSAFHLASSERKKTIRHLTLAYGNIRSTREIRQMAEDVFINLGRNSLDALRLPVVLKQNELNRIVKVEGLEYLRLALAKGNGVIVVTGHIGNWELMATYLANNGYPIWAVGAKVYDPRLNKIIAQQREQAGYHNIERGRATRQMYRALKQNGVVGLLIDQDTQVEGVFVDFFGKLAFTPVGPVSLALKMDVAIVPMAIHIKKDYTHLISIRPAIKLSSTGNRDKDRQQNTEKCSKEIEAFIRKHPTQWVWMHERWKTRPEMEREMD